MFIKRSKYESLVREKEWLSNHARRIQLIKDELSISNTTKDDIILWYKWIKEELIISKQRIEELEHELEKSQRLENVLTDINTRIDSTSHWFTLLADGCYSKVFGDDSIATYVDDIVTGWKVIKQEWTKAILIDEEWNVKEWLTRKEPLEWYNYYFEAHKEDE